MTDLDELEKISDSTTFTVDKSDRRSCTSARTAKQKVAIIRATNASLTARSLAMSAYQPSLPKLKFMEGK